MSLKGKGSFHPRFWPTDALVFSAVLDRAGHGIGSSSLENGVRESFRRSIAIGLQIDVSGCTARSQNRNIMHGLKLPAGQIQRPASLI